MISQNRGSFVWQKKKEKGHLLTNYQILMKKTQKNIRGIDKTMAKPDGVVKNYEKTIIGNRALY